MYGLQHWWSTLPTGTGREENTQVAHTHTTPTQILSLLLLQHSRTLRVSALLPFATAAASAAPDRQTDRNNKKINQRRHDPSSRLVTSRPQRLCVVAPSLANTPTAYAHRRTTLAGAHTRTPRHTTPQQITPLTRAVDWYCIDWVRLGTEIGESAPHLTSLSLCPE